MLEKCRDRNARSRIVLHILEANIQLCEIIWNYDRLCKIKYVKSSYYWHTCHTKIELRFSLVNRNQVKSKFLFEAWERPDSKAMFKHVQVLRTGQWKVPWPAKFNPVKAIPRHGLTTCDRADSWFLYVFVVYMNDESDCIWLILTYSDWISMRWFGVASTCLKFYFWVLRQNSDDPCVESLRPSQESITSDQEPLKMAQPEQQHTAARCKTLQNTCETLRKDAESYQCALTIPDPTKSNWGKGWLQQ